MVYMRPLIEVELYYPAGRYGDPPKAEAVGKARLTATQIVVVEARVTVGTIRIKVPRRYKRKNLWPIGALRHDSWQLSGRPEGA